MTSANYTNINFLPDNLQHLQNLGHIINSVASQFYWICLSNDELVLGFFRIYWLEILISCAKFNFIVVLILDTLSTVSDSHNSIILAGS